MRRSVWLALVALLLYVAPAYAVYIAYSIPVVCKLDSLTDTRPFPKNSFLSARLYYDAQMKHQVDQKSAYKSIYLNEDQEVSFTLTPWIDPDETNKLWLKVEWLHQPNVNNIPPGETLGPRSFSGQSVQTVTKELMNISANSPTQTVRLKTWPEVVVRVLNSDNTPIADVPVVIAGGSPLSQSSYQTGTSGQSRKLLSGGNYWCTIGIQKNTPPVINKTLMIKVPYDNSMQYNPTVVVVKRLNNFQTETRVNGQLLTN